MDEEIRVNLADYERLIEVIEEQRLELQKLQKKVDLLKLQVESSENQSLRQGETIDKLSVSIRELKQGNIDRFNENVRFSATIDGLQKLNVTDEYVEKLNIMLSSHRTVWGNKDRLHISKLASVESCIFNTNSGSIWIGDYVFSGSRVSILAGSHEVTLTGHLRREYEKKDGCDVVIEDGVWLASNSTILGPAKIGRNSVVAAGSVVVPGTIIPPNTICGGIPARVIKRIDFGNTKNAILSCLDKHDGVIYGDGWSEKKEMNYGDAVYRGHMLERNVGKIYTTQEVLKIFYLAKDFGVPKLRYVIDGKEEEISIDSSGEISFSFGGSKSYPYEIDIKNDDKGSFFCVKIGV